MPKSKCPGTEPYLGTFQILNGDLGKYTHFLQAILFFQLFSVLVNLSMNLELSFECWLGVA